MRKNVLVIGSQGYIGSKLTRYLQDRNYNCIGIDTGFFAPGLVSDSTDCPTSKLDAREILAAQVAGYDAVVMLAGISNDPFGNLEPERIYDPTRDYAVQIAKYCKELGIKYVYPSSCSVYGAAGSAPLNEKSTTNPQTPYSANKLQVEAELMKIAHDGFAPVALRFGTVYGMSPRIRFDVVINMLCGLAITTNHVTLNSNGQAWRPHLHIEDACEAIRCAIELDSGESGLVTLNVGQDEDNYRIIDIAKLIHDNVPGSNLNFLDNEAEKKSDSLVADRKISGGVDTRTYKVSFAKIQKTMPEFNCKWNVPTGIANLLEEMKRMDLDECTFKKRAFYRLQQIEYLFKNGLIDENLHWKELASAT